MEKSTPDQEVGSVALLASGSALGVLVSRILGMARDIAIARYVDTNTRDAFLGAFRFANVFRRLFGEGALSISIVPILGDILRGGSSSQASQAASPRAREFVSGLFSILVIVMLSLCLLGEVFMRPVLSFLLGGQGFDSVPGKLELAVHFGRAILLFPIFASHFALFMAIYQTHRRLLAPALAPAVFNLVMIMASVFGAVSGTPPLYLGYAVAVGGFLQMAVLIPGVVRLGLMPKFTLQFNTPDIARFLKAVGPGFFALSVFQLKILVNVKFASLLPAGSQSYLYLAERLLELPTGLFIVSIGAALLPTLALAHARGAREQVTAEMNHSLRLALFIAIPAAIGLLALSTPIIETLFLGREFRFIDSLQTVQLVRIFSATIVLTAGIRILSVGFYSIGNTWYPALATAVSLISHVIFAFVLMRTWGLNGLAAASVFSMTVNLFLLARGHVKWVAPIDAIKLVRSVFVYFLGAGFMVLLVMWFEPIRHALGAHSTIAKAAVLMCLIVAGLGVYLLVAHLLRVPEYAETLASLRSRFANLRNQKSRRDGRQS